MTDTTSLDETYSQSSSNIPKQTLGFMGASAMFFVSGMLVFIGSLTQYQVEDYEFIGGATAPTPIDTVGYTFAQDPTFLSTPTLFSLIGVSLLVLGIVSMYVTENKIAVDMEE